MGAKPATRTVADVMTREVLTVARNDALIVPDNLMQEHSVRHLPVLDDDGLLCGLVSSHDLFRGALLKVLGFGSRAEQSMLETMVVKEAMTESPRTVASTTPLTEAAQILRDQRIGCLPVVDGDKLVGIITAGDFVRLVAHGDH